MKTLIVEDEKTITLYKDEDYHLRTQQAIDQQREAWQEFADEFKALELGDLEGQQLMNLYAATSVVALELWKQKQIVPPGFNPDKYYDQLIKPNLTPLQDARDKLTQLHPDLFFAEKWQIKVNDKTAEQLKTAHDIVMVKNSTEHKNFKKLHDLKNLLQELRLIRRSQVSHTVAPVDLGPLGLSYNQWATPGSEDEYRFDPQKLKTFLTTLND